MAEWKNITDNPRYKISTEGDVVNTATGHKLHPIKQRNGYTHVTLCGDNGQHQYSVHRLVAKEFIPNPDGFTEINHMDGNKQNNNASNLEWCSRSTNMRHAYMTGLQKPIPEQINHSLTKAVDALKKPVCNVETGARYASVNECARSEGISPSTVSMQLTGKIKHCRFKYADEEVDHNGKQA